FALRTKHHPRDAGSCTLVDTGSRIELRRAPPCRRPLRQDWERLCIAFIGRVIAGWNVVSVRYAGDDTQMGKPVHGLGPPIALICHSPAACVVLLMLLNWRICLSQDRQGYSSNLI